MDEKNQLEVRINSKRWGWLVLFTTSTTLVCCVIPIIMVSLGFGAAVASLYGKSEILTFIGMHSHYTFILSAGILILAGWLLYRPGRTCPSNQTLAKHCNSAHKWNAALFWLSIALWTGSFITAYLLPLFA